MHIRMLDIAAGPEFTAGPGDVRRVEPSFGQALVKSGHAVEVDPGEAQAARRERATASKRATR